VKISEAIEKGLQYVRYPQWNDLTYLELPLKNAEGFHGPWAQLYDPVSACVLQDRDQSWAFPLSILCFELVDDCWEEFTGERFTPEDIRVGRHIKVTHGTTE
jgi:hypothetical protein